MAKNVLFLFVFIFSALNSCGVDLLLKVSTLLPELAAHEKSVDSFIELLRKDQLDDTVSLDALEKSINYFQVDIAILVQYHNLSYFRAKISPINRSDN